MQVCARSFTSSNSCASRFACIGSCCILVCQHRSTCIVTQWCTDYHDATCSQQCPVHTTQHELVVVQGCTVWSPCWLYTQSLGVLAWYSMVVMGAESTQAAVLSLTPDWLATGQYIANQCDWNKALQPSEVVCHKSVQTDVTCNAQISTLIRTKMHCLQLQARAPF